jgi:hypothetical protein
MHFAPLAISHDRIAAMTEITLRGQLVSGQGMARHYTREAWARKAFMTAAGIDPFPGTLNLSLPEGTERRRQSGRPTRRTRQQGTNGRRRTRDLGPEEEFRRCRDGPASAGARCLPAFPDAPNAVEFAKNEPDRQILTLFFAQLALGRAIFAPPDVPRDRVEALSDAFAATMRDPAFQDEAKKVQIETRWFGPERMAEVVKAMAATPEPVKVRARGLLSSN